MTGVTHKAKPVLCAPLKCIYTYIATKIYKIQAYTYKQNTTTKQNISTYNVYKIIIYNQNKNYLFELISMLKKSP